MEALAKLKTKALTCLETVRLMFVKNESELEAADEYRRIIRDLMAAIRHGYDQNIKNAHKTWKDLIASRDEYLHPAQQAEAILNHRMSTYMAAREAKRLEVLEKERKAQEEKDRKELEAKKEKERKIEAAEKAEDFDKVEELVMEEPAPVAAPVVRVPEKLKLKGSYSVTDWKYRVTNIKVVPRSLLKLDPVATNKIVQRDKEKTKIPGIEVYPETRMVTRR